MDIQVIGPDEEREGPIDVVGATWDDEKPHMLGAFEGCWCDPRVEGKYVHHRSVIESLADQMRGG